MRVFFPPLHLLAGIGFLRVLPFIDHSSLLTGTLHAVEPYSACAVHRTCHLRPIVPSLTCVAFSNYYHYKSKQPKLPNDINHSPAAIKTLYPYLAYCFRCVTIAPIYTNRLCRALRSPLFMSTSQINQDRLLPRCPGCHLRPIGPIGLS